MPITFRCPHCGQELTAPDAAAGQSGKCRFCNATIQAPAVSGETAQLIQPGNAPQPPPPPPTPQAPQPGPGEYGDYTAPPPPPGYGVPPPPPGYGAPGYGAPGAPGAPMAYAPTGEVNAGMILGEAWQVVWSNAGLLIGAALVIGLVSGAQGAVRAALERTGSGNLVLIYNIVTTILLIPLNFGLWHLAYNIITGGGSLGDIVKPYQRMGTWIGVYFAFLVVGLPGLALAGYGFYQRFGLMSPERMVPGTVPVGPNPGLGTLFIILGMVILAAIYTGFALTPVEIMDRGAGVIEAMTTSWNTVSQNWLAVFGSLILLAIASMAGVLVCCIGVLLTSHLTTVGVILIYRQLRGFQSAGI